MILIQSDTTDASTNDVLDWIFFMGQKHAVHRINNETIIHDITFKISSSKGFSMNLVTDQGNINSNDITQFWYRRGNFRNNSGFTLSKNDIKLKEFIFKIEDNFQREKTRMMDNISLILEKGNRINRFQENFTNKIYNLSHANDAGLCIPETLLTNNMEELLDFSLTYDPIITKDIEFNSFQFIFEENSQVFVHQPVHILSKNDIQIQSSKYDGEKFGHFSMYQQYIEKKYELRIFYLKGKFYPMAIFSQASEKTKIDFRNYDKERPNRCVPYKLPQEIEQKLICFMQSIDMNSGSIDMIYTPEGEYVFLEVNPVGQFQWLSKSCNYDIEREIALDLINETND